MPLVNLVDTYLAEYARHAGMDAEDVLSHYFRFVSRYVADLHVFEESGLYPFEVPERSGASIDRTTYDIFLIVSTLITAHRFEIMQRICETQECGEPVLVVGVGSGMELLLLEGKHPVVEAYDLSLSDFCRTRFRDCALHESDFRTSRGAGEYGAAYAIEFLEHFRNPYALLDALRCAIRPGGRLVVTTAAQVPQFDHLYKFADADEFERRASAMDLQTMHKWVIPHFYMMSGAQAHNVFYVLRRGR